MKRTLLAALAAMSWTISGTAGAVAPPAECRAAADDPRLRDVIGALDKVRAADPQVWNDYRPAEASYVLLQRGSDQRWCAAIWQAGNVRMVALAGDPKFSTPMYGFHSVGGSGQWVQPAAIAQQLEGLGVRRAVVVPLTPEIKLPFELKPLSIFDLAVHEAVHVNVQSPSWIGQRGDHDWPAWSNVTPARPSLASTCYTPSAAALEHERGLLVEAAMTALASGDRAQVCASTRAFAEARQKRWTALGETGVSAPGENASAAQTMTCRQAEAVMELNEGVPDFIAWISAYEAGVVDAARVKSRFLAQQRDVFYLTGAMQLVVLRHLLGDEEFRRLTHGIATSASWRDGELFAAVEAALATHCQ